MNTRKPVDCPTDVEDCPRVEEQAELHRRRYSFEINVPTMLAGLTAFGIVMSFFVGEDRRVTKLEEGAQVLKENAKTHIENSTIERSEYRQDIKEIKDKLDTVSNAVAQTRTLRAAHVRE